MCGQVSHLHVHMMEACGIFHKENCANELYLFLTDPLERRSLYTKAACRWMVVVVMAEKYTASSQPSVVGVRKSRKISRPPR